ncbi:MAG TPA: hypothetical protein VE667_08610, partial [Xanthobacteraceae bacterium]|nr:hypothetical protein [Xanthobacteraceae bacterium]
QRLERKRPTGHHLHCGDLSDLAGIFLIAILAVPIAGLSPAVPAPKAARETQSYAPPRDDKRS